VERERDVVPPKPTRKLPDVSLKRVTRSNETVSKTKATPKPNTRPNNQLTQVAKAAQAAAKSIRQNVSDSPVEMPELHGPGGGGVPYANFLDGIRKRYSDAWLVPDGVTDDEATATASVTIARDGTVLSSRLIQSSGNALADQSVEMTLRRVTFAEETRRQRLAKVMQSADTIWTGLNDLMDQKVASTYDQAAAQLQELRDAHELAGEHTTFQQRLTAFRERYKRRPAMLRRIEKL
jgi:hypothetical protein